MDPVTIEVRDRVLVRDKSEDLVLDLDPLSDHVHALVLDLGCGSQSCPIQGSVKS